jgi:hypothetical protein
MTVSQISSPCPFLIHLNSRKYFFPKTATAFQYMSTVPQAMLHDAQPGSPESTASSIAPSTPPTAAVSTRAQHALNEITAKASSLPDAFYPEFLQYSKESYEQSTGLINKKRRRRTNSRMAEDTDGMSDDEDTNE